VKRIHASLILSFSLVLLSGLSGAGAPVPAVSGMTIETERHVFTVGENGLPAQVFIKPVATELPLERRAGGVDDARQLNAIGRGNMLRAPARIVATVDGAPVAADVTRAASPQLRDGRAVLSSQITAGDTTATLELVIDGAGTLSGTITYAGGTVEALELIFPLVDAVDTVIVNNPTTGDTTALPADFGTVARGGGTVWGNAGSEAAALDIPPAPGVPDSLYIGTGDRGFTWLSQDAQGWITDPARSTMLIERNAAGELDWRVRLVNRPGPIPGNQTVTFALLTHPAGSRPADHRRQAWLQVPEAAAAVVQPDYATWRTGAAADLVRADAAMILEAFTGRALLEGPAGGDARSAAVNHAQTYPIGLIRYLSGSAGSAITTLRSNAADLAAPGANPSTDRVLLGRALLHDMGLDAATLAHLPAAANTLKALLRFGFFEDDGQTEFIPYWRSTSVARFGQPWDPDSAFDAVDDPNARVHVSIYRRPTATEGRYKALFVIVNEGEEWVRDSFYVLDPLRAFGGINVLDAFDIFGQLDFTGIPERSDWDPRAVQWISRATVRVGAEALRDMPTFAIEALRTQEQGGSLEDIETHGMVKTFAIRDGVESYGPTLFIPAQGFRLLLGAGAKE